MYPAPTFLNSEGIRQCLQRWWDGGVIKALGHILKHYIRSSPESANLFHTIDNSVQTFDGVVLCERIKAPAPAKAFGTIVNSIRSGAPAFRAYFGNFDENVMLVEEGGQPIEEFLINSKDDESFEILLTNIMVQIIGSLAWAGEKCLQLDDIELLVRPIEIGSDIPYGDKWNIPNYGVLVKFTNYFNMTLTTEKHNPIEQIIAALESLEEIFKENEIEMPDKAASIIETAKSLADEENLEKFKSWLIKRNLVIPFSRPMEPFDTRVAYSMMTNSQYMIEMAMRPIFTALELTTLKIPLEIAGYIPTFKQLVANRVRLNKSLISQFNDLPAKKESFLMSGNVTSIRNKINEYSSLLNNSLPEGNYATNYPTSFQYHVRCDISSMTSPANIDDILNFNGTLPILKEARRIAAFRVDSEAFIGPSEIFGKYTLYLRNGVYTVSDEEMEEFGYSPYLMMSIDGNNISFVGGDTISFQTEMGSFSCGVENTSVDISETRRVILNGINFLVTLITL